VTILIVDDNSDNLIVMEKVIQKSLPDVTIITCQHPEKAQAILSDTNVALALIDVQMSGIDGLELCKRIMSNPETQNISVVLITSYSTKPEMKARGLALGADDFIMRPIDNAELIARVKVALRTYYAEEELRNVNRRKTISLDKSERTLQAVFNNVRDGIMLVDLVSHQIYTANPAMCRMLGV